MPICAFCAIKLLSFLAFGDRLSNFMQRNIHQTALYNITSHNLSK
jgi:hypothetical protein